MKKSIIIMVLMVISCYCSIYAQESRTSAMGGLSYSIYDKDVTFDLYDFGKNPAWLIESEKDMWLDIDPSVGNSWGNYRRKFSSDGVYNLKTGVTGVKPLGASGTFKAAAYYNYEFRRNTYRTLIKDTYAGESFFFTDTTTGDVRFNGPTFMFSHSLMLMDNLYIGAQVNYQILSGLKKKYSFAETTYRDVYGVLGLAYKISENFVLGLKYSVRDQQEAIRAEDVNLFSIEAYQYRGETYAVLYRSSVVNHKVRKMRNEYAMQIYFSPIKRLKIGVSGEFDDYYTKILVPKSSIIDAPEGYTSYGEYTLNMQAQYSASENLIVGIKTRYNKIDNWSKNSGRDLLLWEWNTDVLELGAGGSYKFDFYNLVLGAEYSFIKNNADSSKYIDDRFASLVSNDNLIKVGFEFAPAGNLKIRGGINYCTMEHDLLYGGNDVSYSIYTFGLGYSYLDLAVVDITTDYMNYKIKNENLLKQNNWSTKITLRLFTF
ncbi:MAG: hypothetical protein V1773_01665 [bacterium]